MINVNPELAREYMVEIRTILERVVAQKAPFDLEHIFITKHKLLHYTPQDMNLCGSTACAIGHWALSPEGEKRGLYFAHEYRSGRFMHSALRHNYKFDITLGTDLDPQYNTFARITDFLNTNGFDAEALFGSEEPSEQLYEKRFRHITAQDVLTAVEQAIKDFDEAEKEKVQ